MGWLVNKVVKKDVVIADFASLVGNVKAAFVANVNQCAGWNGEISPSRKRRSVEEPEVGEENVETVETVESGGLLGWVKNLVRSKRQAPGSTIRIFLILIYSFIFQPLEENFLQK